MFQILLKMKGATQNTDQDKGVGSSPPEIFEKLTIKAMDDIGVVMTPFGDVVGNDKN